MRAHVVVDLGYGDAGKGATVDWLVREYHAGLVVRFNGGPQAGHNVVLPDGTYHEFSQWGAGTLAGVPTHLSRFVLVNPIDAEPEAAHLEEIGVANPYDLVSVDPRAVVITPWHVAANRLKEEARGGRRHGSCGRGVGAAREDEIGGYAIRVGDLIAGNGFRDALDRTMGRISVQLTYWMRRTGLGSEVEGSEWWGAFGRESVDRAYEAYLRYADRVTFRDDATALSGVEEVVCEGAQGVLLDETWGWAPYHTWTDCTFTNADTLLRRVGAEEVVRIGVVRSYMTRHGAGPFPTEDPDARFPEPHNDDGPWQGAVRYGWADMAAYLYAVRACGGIDELAITHMDRVDSGWRCSPGYLEGPWPDGRIPWVADEVEAAVPDWYSPPFEVRIPHIFEAAVDAPVTLLSYGPTFEDREVRTSGRTSVSL